ncbi:HAD family hydrolase [Robertkochia aurantiaca]|uniref:HAD family hydrolase n=1 Tax=Robertkochia aurantiaca TaxID=2873700 RepID=UPI001CCD1E4E|nr:HAD-IA family hydrolase [Robertkochia sp. 3YJGBD-33]
MIRKHVIFDMDGVLVDSEPYHREVLSVCLEDLGHELSDEYYNSLVGTANRPMWERVKADFSLEKPLEKLIAVHKELFFQMLHKDKVQAVPGVQDVLEELNEKGFRLSLASSSPEKVIDAFMEILGFTRYFDHLVSGENIERSKPAPDIFLKVASLYDVAPSGFVVIEDSKHGVSAAKAAGMSCVGFVNPNSGNQDLSEADLLIASMRELHAETIKSL